MDHEFYLPYPNTENLDRLNSAVEESFIHPIFKKSIKELFELLPQELLSYITLNNLGSNVFRPKSAAKIEIKYTKPNSLYYDMRDIKEEREINRMAEWVQKIELELFNKETQKVEKVSFGLTFREGLTDEDSRMLNYYRYKLFFFINTTYRLFEVEAASDNINDFRYEFLQNDFDMLNILLENFKKYDI